MRRCYLFFRAVPVLLLTVTAPLALAFSDAVVSTKHGVELWTDAPGGHYRLHNTNAYPVSVTWKDDNGKHTLLVHGREGSPWVELWRRVGVVRLSSVSEVKG